MQQRANIILFVLLSALVIGGWLWYQSLYPPTPPEKKGDEQAQKDKKLPRKLTRTEAQATIAVRIVAAPCWQFGTLADVALLRHDLQVARATFPPMPEKKGGEVAKKEPPKKNEAPVATYVLGGDDFHLSVGVTTRGAGVQRLTLTNYQAANYLGQPTGKKLNLIPTDPFKPSYLMYHYQDPDDKNPVLGLDDLIWNVEKQNGKVVLPFGEGGQQIRLWARVPGRPSLKVTKIYSLEPTDYHVGLRMELLNERGAGEAGPMTFRYQLAGAHGLPVEGEWYATTTRNAVIAMVDPAGGVWRELEEAPQDAFRISQRQGGDRMPAASRGNNLLQYAGVVNQFFAALIVVSDQQAPATEGGVAKEEVLAWARPSLESDEVKGRIIDVKGDKLRFESVEPKAGDDKGQVIRLAEYTLLPRTRAHLDELKLGEKSEAVLSFYETASGERIATWVRTGSALRPQLNDITCRVNSEVVTLRPGEPVVHQFLLYHGPVKVRLLDQAGGAKAVPDELVARYINDLHLNTLTDYRSAGAMGKFSQTIGLTRLIIFMTNVMHSLLYYLHYSVLYIVRSPGWSYGLSVILLTILVRGAMFPVSRRQALFSIRMQELAPELKKIGEKYKDDPQARTQATMELYRKHKVHPLSSCLPLVLQMPIFLGLYFCLQESINFRLANFLWIDNLAAPDMLFWWGESIPWISDPNSQGGMLYLGPFFNLLPVIAVALMIVQQQMMAPPPTDEQQAAQQKMMKYMMIFFGVLFYKVAAGLVLYFISSSLWGLAERKLLPKKKPGTAAPAPAPVAASSGTDVRPGLPSGRGPRGRGKNNKPAPREEGALDKVKAWWAEVLKQAKKK